MLPDKTTEYFFADYKPGLAKKPGRWSILVDWSKSQIGICKLIPKRVFLVGVSIFNLLVVMLS